MPRIGNIVVSVLREESATTGEIVSALCLAYTEFPPIVLDSVGFREDGEAYRYASISSIRRAVMPALTKHGVWMHHVYGENERGVYVVTLLRHKSGEYLSSTLAVPRIDNLQDSKAAKTLLCRTCIEGVLSIVTEEDTDAQAVVVENVRHAVDSETQAKWDKNLSLAEMAVATAVDEATLEKYVTIAEKRVSSGDMAPNAVDRIKKCCEARRETLKKEQTSAGHKAVGGNEGPNPAGSGSGEPDGKRQRRPIGTGA